jgi:hypothetical protein
LELIRFKTKSSSISIAPTKFYIYIRNIYVQHVHIIQDWDYVLLIMYNQPNAIICLQCKVELLFIYNYNGNVSFELVYVGWDFGDHHYDNSKTIPDYNSSYIKFHFRIISCCLFCTLSMFLFICILLLFLHPFDVFFWVWTYLINQTFIDKNEKNILMKYSHHSYDILGARMLWKPKEARILKNFIEF